VIPIANDLSSNPWVIDTPGTALLTSMQVFVKGIRWIEGTTAGHLAEIQDKNGKVKWRSVIAGINPVESDLIENIPGWWDGMKVPTLQSGKLYISYE